MQIIYKDGSSIVLSDKGNTYVGEAANKIGHIVRRFNLDNTQLLEMLKKHVGVDVIIK